MSDARPRAERREAEAALAPTEEEREAARKQAPLRELCLAMKTRLMRPVVIVEYQRTAYTYAPGNVRITLDENIGASARIDRFLDPEISLRPILPAGPARAGGQIRRIPLRRPGPYPAAGTAAYRHLFQIRALPAAGAYSPNTMEGR